MFDYLGVPSKPWIQTYRATNVLETAIRKDSCKQVGEFINDTSSSRDEVSSAGTPPTPPYPSSQNQPPSSHQSSRQLSFTSFGLPNLSEPPKLRPRPKSMLESSRVKLREHRSTGTLDLWTQLSTSEFNPNLTPPLIHSSPYVNRGPRKHVSSSSLRQKPLASPDIQLTHESLQPPLTEHEIIKTLKKNADNYKFLVSKHLCKARLRWKKKGRSNNKKQLKHLFTSNPNIFSILHPSTLHSFCTAFFILILNTPFNVNKKRGFKYIFAPNYDLLLINLFIQVYRVV